MPEDTKKKRAKRRNLAKELENLKTYCEVSIEVLTSSADSNPPDFNRSQIAVFEKILAKIGGTADAMLKERSR